MGNSHRQTVHTHRSYDHQAAKLVAALLRVARVTAGLAESNGNLYRRVYDSRHLQADHQELGSAPEPCWAIEYGLLLPFLNLSIHIISYDDSFLLTDCDQQRQFHNSTFRLLVTEIPFCRLC